MMRIAVPLVGLFVVFLMSYVNSYMLRRKQKEFAIETIIGMEQKTVAFLFFLETSVMGAAAILLGVLLGMLLSQIISVIVVQSFGENYHLHLSLFPDTFLGTVIFFGAIVLLLGIKNLFAVRKLKIIQMLQNSQKGVENIPLTRQVGKWVVVCTAVSTVILGMMAALSCLVLHYPAALFRVLFLTFLAAGFLVSAVFFFLAGRKKRDGSGPLKVISLAFSIIAVLLFKIGISGSDGEKALVSPPKIRPGSMRTNNTGSISRAMTATMIFPICFRPAHTAPATAP